jgi:hypothetical protein
MSRYLLLVLTVAAVGCGESLNDRVNRAMDGCVAARNPVFVAGGGETALDTPLPPAVDSLARTLAYKYPFEVFKEIATAAKTQAILTCALELGARYDDWETRQWLRTYQQHPSPAVAIAATRLLGPAAAKR